MIPSWLWVVGAVLSAAAMLNWIAFCAEILSEKYVLPAMALINIFLWPAIGFMVLSAYCIRHVVLS